MHGQSLSVLLLLRTLTVVNDNVLRWLAIGLGKRAVASGGVALVLTLGTAGFVLPFILLAWLAGYLADRYPKRTVIIWCKFAEIVIATGAVGTVVWGVCSGGTFASLPVGLWLLLSSLIVIGCQAAILAPSLVGSIPETVPAAKLSSANGLFATVTLAATLIGMAGGNWLADSTPIANTAAPSGIVVGAEANIQLIPSWVDALPTAIVLIGLAIAGWIAAIWLVPRPAADPLAPPPWNALTRTRSDLTELFRSPELSAAAAGIIFFWALGAVAQLNVDQFATEAGATSQGQIVPLLVALLSGIGLGSLLAGKMSTRGVDLGLVPIGASLMAVGAICLAISPAVIFIDGSCNNPAWWFVVTSLLILGLGAGAFDVPLEAYFQAQSPAAKRGSLLATVNLLVFSGIFAASLLYGLLRTPVGSATAPLLSARSIFGIFSILSTAAVGIAVYAAPRATVRIIIASIVNVLYRFRIARADLMPVVGPAVVVANHLSWLDGFIVVLASPRPIRLVVYGPNIQGRFLQMLAKQWRFILFEPRTKSIAQALKTIQTGLANGEVIGIFCEGGISRTGQILGFKRGLEWILERVTAPIVPLSIDGMWGSLLSFSEGRFFTKIPRGCRRPITLTFGPALPIGAHPNEARLALQEITTGVVRGRMLANRFVKKDLLSWFRRFRHQTLAITADGMAAGSQRSLTGADLLATRRPTRTSGAIDSFRTMATLSGLETAYAAVLAGVPLDMSTGQPVNIAIQLDGACGPATYSQRLERIWDWCIAGFGMAQVSSQGPRPPNAPRAFAASSPPSPVLPRRDTNSPRSALVVIDQVNKKGLDWAALAAGAEAFDGACLVHRKDRLLTSLASGDPLYVQLGLLGGALLGIRAVVIDPRLTVQSLIDTIVNEGITIWLGRLDQVSALARELVARPLLKNKFISVLQVVVMPIEDAATLPQVQIAIAEFRDACGIEPVVAFAPRGTGGLVAMNTPPLRSFADHERTNKIDTLGRVNNGVVVWPRAIIRKQMQREPLPLSGVPQDGLPIVIGATLSLPLTTFASHELLAPAACLLEEEFEVDKEGFLVQHWNDTPSVSS